MFQVNDKKRIYWLINRYLNGKLNAIDFTDEYYKCSIELNLDDLTPLEDRLFSELGEIANRFSKFEEDIKNYPSAYYTESELRSKVIDVYKLLPAFKKADKRKIYQIIDKYILNKIDAYSFCNDYLECYGIEVDPSTLTDLEDKKFTELGKLAVEFPTFEQKFQNYQDAYYREETLKKKAIEVKKLLTSL